MIKWDRAGLGKIDKSLALAIGQTGYVLQDDVREEMIVPRALGTLQGEAFHVDDTHAASGYVRLIFNTPYARRLYFHPEYNFRKDQNPNAQGEWMAPWLPGGKYEDRAGQICAEILRRQI